MLYLKIFKKILILKHKIKFFKKKIKVHIILE
jgi:hypothetical protein